MRTKLENLDEGERKLDFRLGRSRWRTDLWIEHRKVYGKEWERRKTTGSANLPIDFLRFPPLEDQDQYRRTDDELSWLDPSLRLPSRPTQWRTDTGRTVSSLEGTCSCPSFLRSRFLLCKHTILSTPPSVLGDGSMEDETLYFDVVERHRTPPFWRVPEIAKERALARERGVVRDDDEGSSVSFEMQRIFNGIEEGYGDFGEGFEGEYGGGYDDPEDWIGGSEDFVVNSDDVDVEEREEGESGFTAGAKKRGKSFRPLFALVHSLPSPLKIE